MPPLSHVVSLSAAIELPTRSLLFFVIFRSVLILFRVMNPLPMQGKIRCVSAIAHPEMGGQILSPTNQFGCCVYLDGLHSGICGLEQSKFSASVSLLTSFQTS